jgi:sugar phosphate isomerase/epimerase
MTRKEFLKTVGAFAVAGAIGSAAPAKPKIKRGVSLYSYQEELYTRTMSVEDCIREIADMGAEGVEIIAEEFVPNFPDPPERWVAQWREWIEKYHAVPSCYDQFLETKIHRSRDVTGDEAVAMMQRDLKLARRMGFKTIRLVNNTPVELVEKCIPAAEQYDIRIGFEVHAPIPLDGEMVNRVLDLIHKTKTTHIGFVPDLSLFVRRPIRVMSERAIRDGIPAKIVHYIDSAWLEGVPEAVASKEAARMGYTEEPHGYGTYFTRVYGVRMQDPRNLLPLMPYIFHVHAKFWEVTEDLSEYSIPYLEVIPVFIKGGYDQYLSSEFEGQRYTQDAIETESCEQVRRHHAMMKRLLGEV